MKRVLFAVLALCTLAAAAPPPATGTLPPDVLRANQEIDQKFLDAHRTRDTATIMGLFTTSPEIFFISPAGEIYKGRDQVRQSIETFFGRVITMTGAIDHVTYLAAGDGVIAYGQVTYHRQLKGRAPDTTVVVWTDYRRKENGKWVLVFRHAHWPLKSLPASTTRAQASGR
jgi:ketosteroid isomerase-like protein